MKTKNSNARISGESDFINDRHILLALDESENSKRALLYTADFLGGVPEFHATLLTIVSEPPEDYFDDKKERVEWVSKQRADAEKMLKKYRKLLIEAGFNKDKVEIKAEIRHCPSIAECIIEEQKRLGCCTIILGRRGISKKEEFIFGSTSSKILHSQKNCAVWVIE